MCETAIQTILGESLLLNSPMQPVLGEDLPKLLTGNELMLSFAGLNDVDTTHVHLPMFEELYENTDDQLFNKTVENSNHVLHTVLPQPSVAS